MREEVELREKALLVGVDSSKEEDFAHTMEELGSLAEACNMQVVGIITQKMDVINKALYIGSGKVQEVKEYAEECEADIIIFDNVLSPSQIRNLDKELDRPILDRTALILEIFSQRAQTREAKLQVETAKLQYYLPRLTGMGHALSRQGGTSGSMSSRGAGEKKIELDRRKIEKRISELKRELEEVAKDRQTQRKRRELSRTPQVALVGYTNAGKSTIMNRLVEKYGAKPEKQVLEQDMLFATLDTSVRLIEAENNISFFLSDTVGFIHKLPHGLVKAFRSTLEEVRHADLLVQVIDYSDQNYRNHLEVTADTLKELEAGDIPMIYVYNKAELCRNDLPYIRGNQIFMSARTGAGLDNLIEMIQNMVYADHIDSTFLIPYEKGGVTSYFMDHATVFSQDYEESGVRLHVNCHRQDAEKYKEYKVGELYG